MQKKSLEILSSSDVDRWSEVLAQIGQYDFYHLPQVHQLAEIYGEGRAVMPVFREGNYVIAFPMLLRDIDMSCNEGYCDASSVRGLAGPLASSADIPEEVKHHFQLELQDFFEQNRIISAYSRLNPFLGFTDLLSGYGQTTESKILVSIDLTASQDIQESRYINNHKRQIKRLRTLGFTCEEVGLDHLDDFLRIYYNTMDRRSAVPIYYFDEKYFRFLVREMPGIVRFVACKDGDNIAYAGIFSFCGNIIHYHFGATDPEYYRLSPSKLAIDTIRNWGNEMGAVVFQLGSGVGAERDSLYEFKMGFGSEEHTYCTWRHIANQPVYDELCRESNLCADNDSNTSYFPAYRDPKLQMNNVTK